MISIPGRIANRYGHGEKLAYRIAKINNIPFVRTAPEYETRGGAKEGYELSPNDISLQLEYDQTAVAVIDDVMMSGGSMRTVGQLAFDSGADRVVGLVAAKTLRNRAS